MGADERVWRAQFDQLCSALETFTYAIEGERFIDEAKAQPAVVRAYQAMAQVGYAKGWM